nr:MAG TPA: hypothetical protein [Bacteriophage sp.]
MAKFSPVQLRKGEVGPCRVEVWLHLVKHRYGKVALSYGNVQWAYVVV